MRKKFFFAKKKKKKRKRKKKKVTTKVQNHNMASCATPPQTTDTKEKADENTDPKQTEHQQTSNSIFDDIEAKFNLLVEKTLIIIKIIN